MKLLLLAIVCGGIAACSASSESNAPTPSGSKPMGKDVDYVVDGKTMQGYLAVPADSDSKRPAVLIVHDWNGIDGYEKGRADQLAELGYVAFCADIYGKGVRPANAAESGKEATKYYSDPGLLNKRSRGALDFLMKNDQVLTTKVAAIGYCFGGKTVLEMARAGMPLAAVVSFHGSLATQTPLKKGVFSGAVMILHGADDPFVPAKDVDAVKAEMTNAGVPFTFKAYAGAVHAFTVPSNDDSNAGAKYNKEADLASWAEMKGLFDKTLQR